MQSNEVVSSFTADGPHFGRAEKVQVSPVMLKSLFSLYTIVALKLLFAPSYSHIVSSSGRNGT